MIIGKKKGHCLFTLIIVCLIILNLSGCQEHIIGILNPKGLITYEERKLFFDTLALMLIVVLPVIIMSFTFVIHYHSSNREADYKPNWSHSLFLESLWWGIPFIIITILAVLTWKKTYELDPYNKITDTQPLLIQAIALPWKWLFIYPEEGIATVNYVMMPIGRPVEYWLTTDNVPMSAFFIPQLGSQIYAMAGMRTRVHLLANQLGHYDGMNALYNGAGFSGMHFDVHVVSEPEMEKWIQQIKGSATPLTNDTYLKLLIPSTNTSKASFIHVNNALFDQVIHLYMTSLGTQHPRANLNIGNP